MLTNWRVLNEGSFASVRVELPPNASLKTESDAVVSMSETVQVSGQISGGILGSMFRSFFSNESFFTTLVDNRSERAGDVLLAPSDPGGIVLHRVQNGDSMMLTSGSYLACDTSIQINTVVQRGIRNSLTSGTGFFLMKATGRGILAISSYGSIHKYTLLRGERRLVDNGHLVAWTAAMQYEATMASASIWGSISSGEGLMCCFHGPGTIYLQSHKPKHIDGDTGSNSGGSLKSVVLLMVFIFFTVSVLGIFAYNNMMMMGGTSHRQESHYNNHYGRNQNKIMLDEF